MAVIYIKEQGATVQKVCERLVVSKNHNNLLDVPVIQVDDVVIIGNVQVTTQALHMLMERGTDISYISYSGKYLGHTSADSSKNIFLRFEQYQLYLDYQKRLSIAKNIVKNKIENQMSLLMDYDWSESEYSVNDDLIRLKQLSAEVGSQDTTNKVMGIEGLSSNIYFGAFGKIIKGDFVFEHRNRRPPKDPVNVILSLGYTLLTKEICNALDSNSFENYLGFLHGIRYGRKSLGLDIIEEFRQPVIDRLTYILFNKRMLGKYDFDFQEDGRVVLNEDGFSKFCKEYEKWMRGNNTLAGDCFRKRINDQVSLLKKSIINHIEYVPYSWRKRDVCD